MASVLHNINHTTTEAARRVLVPHIQNEPAFLLPFDFTVKKASGTVAQPSREDSLHLAATECAGDRPTVPPAVRPAVHSIMLHIRARRADPQLVCALTTWFAPAPHILPAVHFLLSHQFTSMSV
jgi:hypothetical protein